MPFSTSLTLRHPHNKHVCANKTYLNAKSGSHIDDGGSGEDTEIHRYFVRLSYFVVMWEERGRKKEKNYRKRGVERLTLRKSLNNVM